MFVALLVAIAAAVSAATPAPVSRLPAESGRWGPALPATTPLHLAVVLKAGAPDELKALLKAQQDPHSPQFRQWITPEEFGSRFGQTSEQYDAVAEWLRDHGFQVETSPNRLYLGATGTAGAVRALLGVKPRQVLRADGTQARTFEGTPVVPPGIAASISFIDGLDNQLQVHHRMKVAFGQTTMSVQDTRNFYDIAPLLAQGYTGTGAQLVVLAMAAGPSTEARSESVNYFLKNLSNASTQFQIVTLPNPANDLTLSLGELNEQTGDPQAESVADPGAATITSVVAPASEIFSTGINYIVNSIPTATAVSVSYGYCETAAQSYFHDMDGIRTLLQQGLAEGQSWFSSSGDFGQNDCQDGTTAVDFPASVPEFIAVGGTMFSPAFDTNGAVQGYSQESAWNSNGMAGGGGVSALYTKPDYQQGTTPADGQRDIPDIALVAGAPGIVYSLYPTELGRGVGTSLSAPFAAGIAALLSDRLGCRLGDLHTALYALGAAQQGGGAAVFHDITKGNISNGGVTGPSAAPGFDLATGWGSLDVAALAAALPPCPTSDLDGGVGTPDAAARQPYDPCVAIGCGGDGGLACVTKPEGPSSCVTPCDQGCPTGTSCSSLPAGAEGCAPGCASDFDCSDGEHCYVCGGACYKSTLGVDIGGACLSDTDCGPGQYCLMINPPVGVCSKDCYSMDENCKLSTLKPCPSGTGCSNYLSACTVGCTSDKECKPGYVCLDPGDGRKFCLPGCNAKTGCAYAPGSKCTEGPYGISACLFPDGGVVLPPGADASAAAWADASAAADAGANAGPDADLQPDAATSQADAGLDQPDAQSEVDAAVSSSDAAPILAVDAGASKQSSGCGCASGPASPASILLALGLLVGLGRRRQA